MPYVSTSSIIETRGHKVRVKHIRALRVRNRFRTRRALHVKSRIRRSILNRKLAHAKTPGQKHTRKKGVHHVLKHKRVVKKHYTRKKHAEHKRKRTVHEHRRAVHHIKRRVVHKGYHHRKHSHVVHHARRPHKGYRGPRKPYKKR